MDTMAMPSICETTHPFPQPFSSLRTPQHMLRETPGRLQLKSASLSSRHSQSQVTAAKKKRALSVTAMTLSASKEAPSQTLPPPPPNRLHEVYTKYTWIQSVLVRSQPETLLASSRSSHLHVQMGQSPWIDNLTRDWASSGHLEELMRRGVRGLTSNPTIFEKAIGHSPVYDDQIRDLVRSLATSASDAKDMKKVEELYWEIAKTDITTAAGIMKPLYDQSQGGDGFVSLEVSPALAHDSAGTAALARSLHCDLGLPNLMVKIPATQEGLPAIRELISEGRNINVTLIFSLRRYADVMEAYISGLEALAASSPGASLARVASVASFFISRVDTSVDGRLSALGTPEADALKGRAAVAQGVMAYQLFLKTFSGPRWEALARRGARAQRPLWASTGVKNKAYPDTLYVDELVGPNTVNTMPDATLLGFADHGKCSDLLSEVAQVARAIDRDVEGARKVLESVAALGIDMEEVAQELEADGVKKFADSFDSLLSTLQGKIARLM